MTIHTRLHDRLRFRTWVKVITPAGANLLGNIEDLSPAGLGMVHNAPLPEDQDCDVFFMLPLRGREHIIQARGRIAACRPTGLDGQHHIGLAFQGFATNATDALELINAFILHSQAQP
ncbi:PilZ domain-containing protein [Chitinimonas naiadis]